MSSRPHSCHPGCHLCRYLSCAAHGKVPDLDGEVCPGSSPGAVPPRRPRSAPHPPSPGRSAAATVLRSRATVCARRYMVRRIVGPGKGCAAAPRRPRSRLSAAAGTGPGPASSCGRCGCTPAPIRGSGRQAAARSPYPGGPGRPPSGPASPQLRRSLQKSCTQGDSFRGHGRSAYRGVPGAGDLGPV
jgi:hypothetical protein